MCPTLLTPPSPPSLFARWPHSSLYLLSLFTTLSTFLHAHLTSFCVQLAIPLLDFTNDHVVVFTEDVDKETRQAAVLACAKVRGWNVGEMLCI